jgi:hypothetical protein
MKSAVAKPIAALIALVALVLLAGCGGDDSSGQYGADSDPQEVLEAALGSEGESIQSGVLDLSFGLEATGEDAGSLTASVTGPFSSGGEGQLPLLDLEASANIEEGGAAALDFSGGLTVTDDGAFVTYDGTAYEVDAQTFALLEQSYAQSAQLQESEADEGSLEAFGIEPAEWMSELTNEGTEDLDGDDVVHVAGSADVPQIIADLENIAEQTGQASELDEAGLQEVQQSVTDAQIDVYADTSDGTLRKLDLSLGIANPTGEGDATVTLSIGIAEPNEDQEIEAPDDPQPIADLLGQIPGGAEALGGLGGATAPTDPSGATGQTAPSGAAAEDYYECAASAKTAADLEACAELVAP